jgi:hypothetical protein
MPKERAGMDGVCRTDSRAITLRRMVTATCSILLKKCSLAMTHTCEKKPQVASCNFHRSTGDQGSFHKFDN